MILMETQIKINNSCLNACQKYDEWESFFSPSLLAYESLLHVGKYLKLKFLYTQLRVAFTRKTRHSNLRGLKYGEIYDIFTFLCNYPWPWSLFYRKNNFTKWREKLMNNYIEIIFCSHFSACHVVSIKLGRTRRVIYINN